MPDDEFAAAAICEKSMSAAGSHGNSASFSLGSKWQRNRVREVCK
jgi:hypothetical protein